MSVRIRMKKMGRTHRPFFRICAFDKRAPRDGRALEELGTYDPMIADIDARVTLKRDRVDYWISVGAQPSEKMAVLIKKYGTEGTHLTQQAAAFEKLAMPPEIPDAGEPASLPQAPEPEKTEEEKAAEQAAAEAPVAEAPVAEAPVAEAPVAEAPVAEAAESPAEESVAAEAPAEEAKAEEPAAEEAKAEEAPAEAAAEEKPAEA